MTKSRTTWLEDRQVPEKVIGPRGSCIFQTAVSSAFQISRSQVTLWKAIGRNDSKTSTSGPELADISWKRLGAP